MKKSIFWSVLILACAAVMMAGSVQAGTIYGTLWDPGDPSAQNPILGPPSGSGIAIATFTVDQLNFSSYSFVSYDTWLSGGSGNPNNLKWVSDPNNVKGDFYTLDSMRGTFFQFTGSMYITPGDQLNITHDDGIYLAVGGETFNKSTPVSPTLDTFTLTPSGGAGIYGFTLWYGAVNTFPEVLVSDLKAVPEPITMVLLGLGLVGLAGAGRKFKK